jgi:hypothetical protein
VGKLLKLPVQVIADPPLVAEKEKVVAVVETT